MGFWIMSKYEANKKNSFMPLHRRAALGSISAGIPVCERMKLIYRIGLALLTCSLLALAAMALMTRAQLDRDFLEFLNRTEQNQLLRLMPELQAHYLEYGDWEAMRDDDRLWREMLRDTRPEQRSERPPPREHRPPPHPRNETDGSRDRNRPPPPGRRGDSNRHPADRNNRQGPGRLRAHGPGRPPPGDQNNIGGRLVLLDAYQLPVIGKRGELDPDQLRPVIIDGDTVGYLGIQPLKNPQSREALEFLSSQNRALLLSAAISLLLSIAVAWVLARQLSTPIRTIAGSIRSMASGRYQSRLEMTRQDELGELARDANQLAVTLSDNEVARQRWMADIAHELRTPLSILRGEIEAVQDGVRELDESMLTSLHDELSHINGLVDDLHQLAISDIGSLDYRFSAVDLVQEISTVTQSMASRFDDAKLALDTDLPDSTVMAQVDQKRFRQMLHNLLGNCLRYTESPGRCLLQLKRSEDRLRLVIGDSGPGVSDDDMARLFERHYRIRQRPARETGTDTTDEAGIASGFARGQASGLGLSIVRNIVEAHQGSICASHSPLGGLAIEITLPAK